MGYDPRVLLTERRARALAYVTSVAFVAGGIAGAMSALRLDPPVVRGAELPGLLAGGSVIATVGALALIGLRVDRVVLAEAGFVAVAFLLGAYASESILALPMALAVVVLFLAYRKTRRPDEAPMKTGSEFLVASVLCAVVALAAFHYQPRVIQWQRTRGHPDQITVTIFDGTCGIQRKHEIDGPNRDSGCDTFLPHPASYTVAVACALCVASAYAAAHRRRLA